MTFLYKLDEESLKIWADDEIGFHFYELYESLKECLTSHNINKEQLPDVIRAVSWFMGTLPANASYDYIKQRVPANFKYKFLLETYQEFYDAINYDFSEKAFGYVYSQDSEDFPLKLYYLHHPFPDTSRWFVQVLNFLCDKSSVSFDSFVEHIIANPFELRDSIVHIKKSELYKLRTETLEAEKAQRERELAELKKKRELAELKKILLIR